MTGRGGHVSICIVGFRNAGEIAQCLTAIGRLTYADFDVVICENGGSQSHVRLMATVPARLPGGQVVECLLAPGNVGYAGGVNVCMRARPDSDGWWIVNPDTQPEPEALSALVDRVGEGDCDAAAGILYHPGGSVQAYAGRWHPWLARTESLGMGRRLADPVDRRAIEARMDYMLGASMFVSRAFRDKVGLMREDYFLYAEEVEWGLRAAAKNVRIGFAPGSRVLHGQGGTTGSAEPVHKRPRMPIYMDERNKLHVARDTRPLIAPVVAFTTLGLLTLRYLARGAWRQWGYALAGWWAGIRACRGRPPWLD